MIEFPNKIMCLSVGIPSIRDHEHAVPSIRDHEHAVPSTRDHEHAVPSTRDSYEDETKHIYEHTVNLCKQNV